MSHINVYPVDTVRPTFYVHRVCEYIHTYLHIYSHSHTATVKLVIFDGKLCILRSLAVVPVKWEELQFVKAKS